MTKGEQSKCSNAYINMENRQMHAGKIPDDLCRYFPIKDVWSITPQFLGGGWT